MQVMGLQHMLSMLAGVITPPLLISDRYFEHAPLAAPHPLPCAAFHAPPRMPLSRDLRERMPIVPTRLTACVRCWGPCPPSLQVLHVFSNPSQHLHRPSVKYDTHAVPSAAATLSYPPPLRVATYSYPPPSQGCRDLRLVLKEP
jgi:hypothetical protein